MMSSCLRHNAKVRKREGEGAKKRRGETRRRRSENAKERKREGAKTRRSENAKERKREGEEGEGAKTRRSEGAKERKRLRFYVFAPLAFRLRMRFPIIEPDDFLSTTQSSPPANALPFTPILFYVITCATVCYGHLIFSCDYFKSDWYDSHAVNSLNTI